jgi:hypothetical protein
MPQRSISRKRKKARRTKQLAEWRDEQEQKKAEGDGSSDAKKKKAPKKATKSDD